MCPFSASALCCRCERHGWSGRSRAPASCARTPPSPAAARGCRRPRAGAGAPAHDSAAKALSPCFGTVRARTQPASTPRRGRTQPLDGPARRHQRERLAVDEHRVLLDAGKRAAERSGASPDRVIADQRLRRRRPQTPRPRRTPPRPLLRKADTWEHPVQRGEAVELATPDGDLDVAARRRCRPSHPRGKSPSSAHGGARADLALIP